MKVCLILEGCYPYVRGGVSAWAHQYISSSPDIEFVLWTIHASRKDTQEMLYTLPQNVTAHHQLYLDENDSTGRRGSKKVLAAAAEKIGAVLRHEEAGWTGLIRLLREHQLSAEQAVASEAFLQLARELSTGQDGLGLSEAFYSLRSMFLPICRLMTAPIPEADLYHSAVAGYGGMVGAMAAVMTGNPFLLTEHGIYPREREEELLSTDWTIPAMLPVWTQLFYDMSRFAYGTASRVTSLYPGASQRQEQIGCDPKKTSVIPNGIRIEQFAALPDSGSTDMLHIGAFVRFAAIKDLRTMIHAFSILHARVPGTVLHLLGGTDDEDYRDSCLALIRLLRLEDAIRVEGHVDTLAYMAQMDVTLLSSISEGQPLTILESMAAGRPCVATRVGNCEGLIETPVNGIGSAGFCCTPMQPEALAACLEKLCTDPVLRRRCGKNGRRRAAERYQLDRMLKDYHALYEEVIADGGHRI